MTAGHEADKFDAKGIIMVPVLVVIVTFLSYVMVTGFFEWLKPGKPYTTPTMSPLAVERNEHPLNDRIARISLNDPNAEIQQPRLDRVAPHRRKVRQVGQPCQLFGYPTARLLGAKRLRGGRLR